jgi:hypothetical protein
MFCGAKDNKRLVVVLGTAALWHVSRGSWYSGGPVSGGSWYSGGPVSGGSWYSGGPVSGGSW